MNLSWKRTLRTSSSERFLAQRVFLVDLLKQRIARAAVQLVQAVEQAEQFAEHVPGAGYSGADRVEGGDDLLRIGLDLRDVDLGAEFERLDPLIASQLFQL
jgi:rhodanese-related sulfurtransferase